MAKVTQDNEPNPWSSIGLQAAMIVNKLRCAAQLQPNEQKNEQPERDAEPGNAGEKNPKADRAYVDHRLREIAAWERRVNGGRKS